MSNDQSIRRNLHQFTAAQLQPLEDRLTASWPPAWADWARIFFIGLLNSLGQGMAPAEMASVAMEQTLVAVQQMGGRNHYIATGSDVGGKRKNRIIPRAPHLLAAAQLGPLEERLPPDWIADWGDLVRIFYLGLLNSPGLALTPDVMAEVVIEQMRVAARQIGGRNNYMPKGQGVQRSERDESIRRTFTGNNVSALAVQHGISDTRVRQIVGLDSVKSRKRSQGAPQRAA